MAFAKLASWPSQMRKCEGNILTVVKVLSIYFYLLIFFLFTTHFSAYYSFQSILRVLDLSRYN